MAVFDLTQGKYVLTEEYNPSAEHAMQQEAAKTQHLSPNQLEPTHTATQNMGASPAKSRRGMSPSKRGHNATSPRKSPSKKAKDATAEGNSHQEKSNNESLTSPTSVSMKDSFIIKNADESFDAYYA